MISHDRLLELAKYDPETGEFFTKISRGGTKAGGLLGCLDKSNGYLKISVDNKQYFAHRLAWFYMTKEWPDQVDHINLQREDNRWENLRHATNTENNRNTPLQKNNSVGLKGVGYHKQSNKWRVQIMVNRKFIHLGLFDCPAAAHFKYVVEADKAFGEFARFK